MVKNKLIVVKRGLYSYRQRYSSSQSKFVAKSTDHANVKSLVDLFANYNLQWNIMTRNKSGNMKSFQISLQFLIGASISDTGRLAYLALYTCRKDSRPNETLKSVKSHTCNLETILTDQDIVYTAFLML